MNKFIPTLGLDGWVNEPEKVADYIISCFLTTNKSQSNLFRNKSDSFQYLLAEFTNDIPGLERRLEELLTEKLRKSFTEQAYAIVKIEPIEGKPDQYIINFEGYIYSDGKEHIVGKVVQTDKSRVIKINEINIYGDEDGTSN